MGRPKGRKVTVLLMKWVTSKKGKKYRRYFKDVSKVGKVSGKRTPVKTKLEIAGKLTKEKVAIAIAAERAAKKIKKIQKSLDSLETKRKELYFILKETRTRPGLMTLGKQNKVRSLEGRIRDIEVRKLKLEASKQQV